MTEGAKVLLCFIIGITIVNWIPGSFWILCALAGMWLVGRMFKGEGAS